MYLIFYCSLPTMPNQFNRKKTRKLLFQYLYAQTFPNYNEALFAESFIQDVFRFSRDEKYLEEMKKIILFREDFFIAVIKECSPKFSIQSMSLSYTLPVYIGLAEMLFFSEEIPAKVSINEAVEVAKVYGDDSSKKIVNGILNKVFQNIEQYIEKAKQEPIKTGISVFYKKVKKL